MAHRTAASWETPGGSRPTLLLPELRRRILIYRGDRRLQAEDGIEVWPVPTFLEALETGTLWP